MQDKGKCKPVSFLNVKEPNKFGSTYKKLFTSIPGSGYFVGPHFDIIPFKDNNKNVYLYKASNTSQHIYHAKLIDLVSEIEKLVMLAKNFNEKL